MARERLLGLTPIQQGMVFHQLVNPRDGVDLEQILIRLPQAPTVSCVAQAWALVVAARPALRRYLVAGAAGDYQLQTQENFVPELVQLPPETDLEAWLLGDRAQGFDLFSQVPIRLALHTGPAGHHCIWTFHHLLLDGRSFPDVLVEVFDAYDALLAGQQPEFAPRPDTQAYLDWLALQDQAALLDYWRHLLADLNTGTLLAPQLLQADIHSLPFAARRQHELQFSAQDHQQLLAAAGRLGVSLNILVQAAWATLLARYLDQNQVLFGVTRAGRAGHVAGAAQMLGVFINTVPVRADLSGSGYELLRALGAQQLAARPHEQLPLAALQQALGWQQPLFDTLVMFDHEVLDASLQRLRPQWQGREFVLREQTPYPVTLYAYAEPGLLLRLVWHPEALSVQQGQLLLQHLRQLLLALCADPGAPLRSLPMFTPAEQQALQQAARETRLAVPAETIDAAFQRCVQAQPDAVALVAAEQRYSYRQLQQAVAAVVQSLQAQGVMPGAVVGVSLDRSAALVAALLGVIQAGAAYLPLDPEYPLERLQFCVADAAVPLVITQRSYANRFQGLGVQLLFLDDLAFADVEPGSAVEPMHLTNPAALAYLIYTSGSTGKPKGVMVNHANVINFFAAMDAYLDVSGEKRWLAVTSPSFDISVLELLWTLTRGFEVVLHRARDLRADAAARVPSFSLFHFASGMDANDPDPYHLILEAARFADTHGFEAIWSPERHFHDFGAPYPNPSVMNAAIATITQRLQLRAGSVVLPLHSSFRVAEEWALVDRISKGRVGIAFASGWQPNDFVLAPQNYEARKQLMFDQIEAVRTLWRGGKVAALNPKGDEVQLGTYPQPLQKELPVWITAAGSPETFARAGAIGANILTHMLGQTLEDLAAQIQRYRRARADAGLDPATGRVTIMVHTFLGRDTAAVREMVRQPLKDYLKSSASLVGNYADAWTAYKQGAGTSVSANAINELTDAEREELYDFAFERYFESSGLFGAVDKALPLAKGLQQVGADEIACLIDFGVAPQTVLDHLPFIDQLKTRLAQELTLAGAEEADVVQDIKRYGISHMQCTPSLARMIPMLTQQAAELASLRQLLIGGEALPLDLVQQLYGLLPAQAQILNMYGPTETTIWSTTDLISRDATGVSIGRPIANTRCYVLDSQRQLVPAGFVGELHIGGAGVTPGYHQRPELTAARFFELALPQGSDRVYATGDLVRALPDGRYEYLGRSDFQVKVRGHRIELGEIETHLRTLPSVQDAVVAAQQDSAGSQQLVGYLVLAPEMQLDAESIKQQLREHLPEFMVPGTLMQLPALPLTPNGKVDRNALPAPGSAAVARAGDAAGMPSSDVQRQIKEVWQRVLNLSNIGIHDNFFEVGGHSILAVKVQSELSQLFGQRLPITELFRRPTIARLAAYFAADDGEEDSTAAASDRGAARRNALNKRQGLRDRRR